VLAKVYLRVYPQGVRKEQEDRRSGDAMDVRRTASGKLHDLGAFIREQRTSAELSLRHLADLAGVSNPYLSQIERGLRKPSAEILQRLAQALRISAETLYVKAGILEERDDDLAERITADPHLSDKQKRALLEVYRSFRTAESGRLPAQDHQEPPARAKEQ
jgi:transcriptional regulator with XRE-family HTH domain